MEQSPSHWSHLLQSNDAPSEMEIPSIRQFILEAQSRLDVLDNEELPSERDALADSIRTHSTILSAVRRVPPELWNEIFTSASLAAPPWSLGLVCRLWRDVVLANPYLWSYIDAGPRRISMIETQLARSAEVPVHISGNWWNVRDADEAALLNLLLPHSHRWETFSARLMTYNAGLVPQLRGIQGQLKEFIYINTTSLIHVSEDKILLANAPSLREIIVADENSTSASPRSPSHGRKSPAAKVYSTFTFKSKSFSPLPTWLNAPWPAPTRRPRSRPTGELLNSHSCADFASVQAIC
ncbi:hypothetical protein FB45DRAFT_788848 [Roridomyces roridus]|uniref:F-box domain-containing protein n=1 Tax=Roridomyces roridus TaxID=1738132 RepID=A0AAD7FPZ3_9AGAR|nr:hypothetical protein FB45DRAFT_788848 [Roridomyces roridus]